MTDKTYSSGNDVFVSFRDKLIDLIEVFLLHGVLLADLENIFNEIFSFGWKARFHHVIVNNYFIGSREAGKYLKLTKKYPRRRNCNK